MANVLNILQILVAGGIFAAFINLLYNQLSERRQYRQALDQKMIDRISQLVEKYYEQISASSDSLRNALNQTLWAINHGDQIDRCLQIGFYHLMSFFCCINRLTQERPRPLFTEIEAEMDYKERISEVFDRLPFDTYDISLLLRHCTIDKELLSAHEIINLIVKDREVKFYYDIFNQWIRECKCDDDDEKSCEVHQVIDSCYRICSIVEGQIHKMYRIWYDRRVKSPKKRKKRN